MLLLSNRTTPTKRETNIGSGLMLPSRPATSWSRKKNRSIMERTIRCEARIANQLCREDIARVLFETGRCYHDTQKWYLKILLLMPDHLHMLVGIPGNADLANLLRDFKRVTATIARIHWQRNFFDHRSTAR